MPRRLELFSSGSNAKGQLANGTEEDASTFNRCQIDTSPQSTTSSSSTRALKPNLIPPDTRRVVSLSTSGANHTLLLLDIDGSQVYGTGDNSRGQLPPSANTGTFNRIHLDLEIAGYYVVHIAAAWETSYFVLRHPGLPNAPDVVVSMGTNDFGDLGTPPNGSILSKQHVVDLAHLFLSKTVFRVQQIVTSIHHVLLLLETPSGQVLVGWGAHRHGQLGRRQTTTFAPVPVKLPLSTTSPIKSIATGMQHTLLLHESGAVTAWGSNRKNQLAEVADARGVTDVACSWNGSYLASTSGEETWDISATGSGNKGQLGRLEMIPTAASSSSSIDNSSRAQPIPSATLLPVDFPSSCDKTKRRVRKFAAGSEHLLLLLETNDEAQDLSTELWVWGWNEHGNLGLGHQKDVFIPERVDLSGVVGSGRVVDVWAGCGTSWILVEYLDE